MSERCGCGGLFGDDVILWFIILFLLLFWNKGGCGCGVGACATKC